MYRRYLLVAFASGALAVAALPASAQTKWNLPAAYPADNPHSENLVLFAKDVETATVIAEPRLLAHLGRLAALRPVVIPPGPPIPAGGRV